MNPDRVVGPDVVLPGSEQLAPVVFGLLALLAFAVFAVALTVRIVRRRRRPEGRPARRPIVVVGAAVVTVALVVLTVVNLPPSFTSPEFPPIGRLLPDEAFFYRPVGDLPATDDSERTIAAMGPAEIVAGFGGQPHDGIVWGIPFNLVDDDTPREGVEIRTYPDTSFIGEYPVTDPAYIESMPTYGVDNHYVALDRESGRMWELFATSVWFGRWGASSGALWDLDDLAFPKWSTTAAQLPLLPGVLSYDEVERGRIDHVVHATASNISSSGVVWPARATDGRNDDPAAVPMGAWLRLRDDVDLDSLELGPQARVIAEGLREYGMVLSDSSANFALRGTPDARWDRQDLDTLRALSAADLEVVDVRGVVVSTDSMEVRPPA
ncbi:MAG: hypothetical protein M3Y51_09300 [Actinomycetota bacterium]|nr:hypothetical protein [Actinomycetota bacterium]